MILTSYLLFSLQQISRYSNNVHFSNTRADGQRAQRRLLCGSRVIANRRICFYVVSFVSVVVIFLTMNLNVLGIALTDL